MTPLVSIIIPVYKAEQTLPACLAQLRAQTYRHLQIIFVDDCSPDGGLAYLETQKPLLEELGMEVDLLHHEVNRGVASARNTGIPAVRGEYIYSVDADDMLDPRAIQLFVDRAQETGADIIGCEYLLSQGDSLRRISQPEVKTGIEALHQIFAGKMKWNLWLFMIRRSLLDTAGPSPFLPGVNMGEDLMLLGKLLHRASSVSIIHEPLYTYVRSDQQITSVYRPEHWQQVETNVRELESYLKEHASARELELLHQLKLNLKLPLLISTQREDFDRWSTMYPESNAYILKNSSLPFRTKLLQYMAAKKQFWFVVLYNKVIMRWLYKILYK
ncbi:glycosyltransferase family 2 protein [uncultured Porphyromonas sp.]|uniref:glycosyltransferase family 2 protein n=1 Tax=uncultured Porphyromonas sp. TaxID=159274 RepID=UPI0026064B75|nr:glycosyltransferase family 2 protein [uncultured Porphyromonas sp.]